MNDACQCRRGAPAKSASAVGATGWDTSSIVLNRVAIIDSHGILRLSLAGAILPACFLPSRLNIGKQPSINWIIHNHQ